MLQRTLSIISDPDFIKFARAVNYFKIKPIYGEYFGYKRIDFQKCYSIFLLYWPNWIYVFYNRFGEKITQQVFSPALYTDLHFV